MQRYTGAKKRLVLGVTRNCASLKSITACNAICLAPFLVNLRALRLRRAIARSARYPSLVNSAHYATEYCFSPTNQLGARTMYKNKKEITPVRAAHIAAKYAAMPVYSTQGTRCSSVSSTHFRAIKHTQNQCVLTAGHERAHAYRYCKTCNAPAGICGFGRHKGI